MRRYVSLCLALAAAAMMAGCDSLMEQAGYPPGGPNAGIPGQPIIRGEVTPTLVPQPAQPLATPMIPTQVQPTQPLPVPMMPNQVTPTPPQPTPPSQLPLPIPPTQPPSPPVPPAQQPPQPVPPTQQQPPPGALPAQVYVAFATANVFEKPDGNSPKVASVPKGAALKVQAEEGVWYRVATPDNKSGWVLKAFTSTTAPQP